MNINLIKKYLSYGDSIVDMFEEIEMASSDEEIVEILTSNFKETSTINSLRVDINNNWMKHSSVTRRNLLSITGYIASLSRKLDIIQGTVQGEVDLKNVEEDIKMLSVAYVWAMVSLVPHKESERYVSSEFEEVRDKETTENIELTPEDIFKADEVMNDEAIMSVIGELEAIINDEGDLEFDKFDYFIRNGLIYNEDDYLDEDSEESEDFADMRNEFDSILEFEEKR